jgi:hypothetical protein
MKLDIRTAVLTALVISLIFALLSAYLGIRLIRSGQKLHYFRKRQDLIGRGWRMVLTAVIFGIAAFILSRYAEPLIYQAFPPSPTVTLTPTITLTQTISLTPTISLTATITETPSITDTPQVPLAVESGFTGVVTPNPGAVFSPLLFSNKIKDNQAIDPAVEFINPISRMYGAFSYDKMVDGSQWSALWYRLEDKTLVCFESLPWNGGPGGYGYTECEPPGLWVAGEYEVQIFSGLSWILSGRFSISGDPPTPTHTFTPTRTLTVTRTKTLSPTISPTRTRWPTVTTRPTRTRIPTWTLVTSLTPRPTSTPKP